MAYKKMDFCCIFRCTFSAQSIVQSLYRIGQSLDKPILFHSYVFEKVSKLYKKFFFLIFLNFLERSRKINKVQKVIRKYQKILEKLQFLSFLEKRKIHKIPENKKFKNSAKFIRAFCEIQNCFFNFLKSNYEKKIQLFQTLFCTEYYMF